MPPFDADNTGRDSSFICNYNHLSSSKLDDGGRRKCTGFVQTLLENFTAQGDIVIDFAGGWGATLQAANNCGRCCIVAETRRDAYDSLQRVLGSLHQPEQANPKPIAAQQKSLGEKPLGDDDDLGDLFETQSAAEPVRVNKRKHFQDLRIFSPEQPYRLPVYAERHAQLFAQLPSSACDTSGSSLDKSPMKHPFVLDEASDDDERIVSLSSDEESVHLSQ
ncbi:hypothetical protein R1sor_015293 [Riccia sorocarpa]|uniref:Trimethylguanosine synthase n=1 Tax=Riccia sorocarpa TaxID=122646 RepID=A0ABD3HI08_9MARC